MFALPPIPRRRGVSSWTAAALASVVVAAGLAVAPVDAVQAAAPTADDCAAPFTLSGGVCTVRLDYTGVQGEVTLPTEASEVTVELAGASGYEPGPGATPPGKGGKLKGSLVGFGGERLAILVGQKGFSTNSGSGQQVVGGGGTRGSQPGQAGTGSVVAHGGGGTFLASVDRARLLAIAGGGGGGADAPPVLAESSGSGSGGSVAGSAGRCGGGGASAASGGVAGVCSSRVGSAGGGPARWSNGQIFPGSGGTSTRELGSGGTGGGGYFGGGTGVQFGAGGGGSGLSSGLSGPLETESTLGGNTGNGYIVLSYTPTTAPDAPAQVSAAAGDGQVTVSWSAPASDGGSPITGYTVTASPGGATCTTTTALFCAVKGLTNGTPYTFAVTASNKIRSSASSSTSAVVPRAITAADCKAPFARADEGCTVTFAHTGQQGLLVLSDDAESVAIEMAGGSGARRNTRTPPAGAGGKLRGFLRGAGGKTLAYLVGQTGLARPTGGQTTRPTGGGGTPSLTFGMSGGGGSFIGQIEDERLLAAAGGGGGGSLSTNPVVPGAAGSGTAVGETASGITCPRNINSNGGGGGPATGGKAGVCDFPSSSGVPGDGPARMSGGVIVPGLGGSSTTTSNGAGLGGGGYFGGGSGAQFGDVGGGGSGYSAGLEGPIAFESSMGGNVGDGYISLTYTPVVAPDAPGGVSGVAGVEEATVSWSAPGFDGGSPVTGYTVTASPGGASCSTTGATSCTVSGLTGGTGYSFSVVASNKKRSSVSSVASDVVTPRVPAVLPVISQEPVDVLAMDERSAVFSVSASGVPAPSFGWEQSLDGGRSWSTVVGAQGATLEVTAAAKLNGALFRAVVSNEAGVVRSGSARLSVSRLLRAPASFRASPGDKRLTLSWVPSVGNKPLPVSSYIVRRIDASGTAAECVVPASEPLVCVVEGLTNTQRYSFSVVAVNAAGEGRVAVTAGTPYAAVVFTEQPVSVTVAAGASFTLSAVVAADPVASLRWQVSGDGGRTWRNTGGVVTGTSTSLTERAQAARSGWRYRVKASQSVGGVSYSDAVTVSVVR